jgi:prevent-host-death family protein
MEETMELAITEAKARLTDLVRRAEDGEDVVLTRHGHAVARLVAIHHKPSAANRAKLIAAIRARAIAKVTVGPSAARSQDFLYDDEGLPK